MAKYWEDWSGHTLDAAPSGWTLKWVTTGFNVLAVQEDESSPTGRRLRINRDSTGRTALTLDAVDSDALRAKVKIRALLKLQQWTNVLVMGPGVAGRVSGSASTETGYIGSGYQNSSTQPGRVTAAKYVSGSLSNLANSANNLIAADTYVWVGLDLDGTSVTYSVAAEATPETVIYTNTVTDSSISAAGGVGIFAFASALGNQDFACVAIATGDDEAFYSNPVEDTTAPVLTSPTGTETGATTASGSVTTDEGNGTLYAVVTTSDTPPSAADIRAGTGADYATDQPVSATGVQNVAATGLTAETTYYWHFLHDDAADNASNVVTSASFTTDVATVVVKGVSVTLHDRATQSPRESVTGITARWWDSPTASGAPLLKTDTASTDASGVLELDLDSVTSLDVAQTGYLSLYKAGDGPTTDLHFAARVAIEDIA